jgi:hypothetical protein
MPRLQYESPAGQAESVPLAPRLFEVRARQQVGAIREHGSRFDTC